MVIINTGRDYYLPYGDPPEKPDVKTCADCVFCKEVSLVRNADGACHVIYACVLECFDASTPEELAEAELASVDVDTAANCVDLEAKP